MSVLVDYFAATADELAGHDFIAHGPVPIGWPHVECKGWLDPLADLTAELTVRHPGEFGDIQTAPGVVESEEEESGAGLYQVSRDVVEALAGVPDQRLAEYAEDEVYEDYETQRLVGLSDLARDAVRSGRDVYFWISP